MDTFFEKIEAQFSLTVIGSLRLETRTQQSVLKNFALLKMTTKQCTGTTKKGAQCKNTTIKGFEYCAIHKNKTEPVKTEKEQPQKTEKVEEQHKKNVECLQKPEKDETKKGQWEKSISLMFEATEYWKTLSQSEKNYWYEKTGYHPNKVGLTERMIHSGVALEAYKNKNKT
jgi:hypothetical protein